MSDRFCVFQGLGDPELDGDPDSWALDGDVSILADTDQTDMLDKGSARWEQAPILAGTFDSISQSILMPPYEGSEPLVLTISQRIETFSASVIYSWFAPVAAIRVGSQFFRTTVTAPLKWQQARLCLGEAAYGGERLVTLSPESLPLIFPAAYVGLDIDHVDIGPARADECPALGEVVDGDFEAGRNDWSPGFALNPALASVDPTAGLGGSAAALIEALDCSYNSSFVTTASVPSSRGGQAFEFAWRSSGEITGDIGFGDPEMPYYMALVNGWEGRPIGTVIGAQSSFTRTRVCVPPDMLGTVGVLSFSIRRDFTLDVCEKRAFIVDDVKIVDEPACASDGNLSDPSFESVRDALLSGWTRITDVARLTDAVFVDDAVDGDVVMQLLSSGDTDCDVVETSVSVLMPEIEAGQVPAVRFSYRFGPTTSLLAGLRVGTASKRFLRFAQLPLFSANDGADAVVTDWTTATVCESEAQAGRPLEFTFTFSPAECGVNVDDQLVQLDAVSVAAVDPSECD